MILFVPTTIMAQVLLHLATVDNFPPFSFQEKGALTGVAIDVVNEMAKRLGISVEIKAYPWSRVLKSIEEGVVDGGFSVFEKEERKAFCLYTGIIQYEEYHLFVKKGKEFPFSGIKDLYGKTIGIDRGVFVSKEFEKAVTELKIFVEEVNDMQMLNVKKVSQGRVDALIGDMEVIPYYAQVSGLAGQIVSLGSVHEKQASYLVLSKNSALPNKAEWQQKITTALKNIWEDGTYQQIVKRFHHPTQQ
jgi:polar amino acid transport system substrate-binding protein